MSVTVLGDITFIKLLSDDDYFITGNCIELYERQFIPRGPYMYHHVKKLMYTVKIGEPDVRFGNMLLEQFGGANGELAAAMQYTIQGWNCVDDLGRRDLLLDIGT
jgi:hypothetical protein